MSVAGTFVESRPWTDEDFSEAGSLGTSSHGVTLNEPLRGWSSFSATFRVMFLEEGRKSVEFAKKRQMVLFPLLLTLVTGHLHHRPSVLGGRLHGPNFGH